MTQAGVEWEAWRCGTAHSPTGLFLALLLPGSAAVVMVPDPDERSIDRDDAQRVIRAGLSHLQPRGLHYAQGLVEPHALAQAALLEEVGFRHLAPLAYLERSASYPWVDPPRDSEAEWVPYGPATHARFADMVQATYEDSLDCPELAGLRPIHDVLAAHKASGLFDPDLWELAQIDGEPAACLLLSRLVQVPALEVVYMGVIPSWRGRGVGGLLLRRGLQRCRERKAGRLTLVVDDRNGPAKALYNRLGFEPVTHRDAWLYRWPAGTSGS